MGASNSGAQKCLWRPTEDQRLFAEQDEKKFLANLWETLPAFFGFVTWKTSSWTQLALVVDNRKEELLKHLNDNIYLDGGTANMEISDVRLAVLDGESSEQQRQTGLFSWLTFVEPRVTYRFDHAGHIVSTTAVNTDAMLRPPPPVPSLDRLGIVAKLQQLERAGQGDTYGFSMALSYSCTHVRPPQGPVSQAATCIVLLLHVEPSRTLVLTISASALGHDGTTEIAATAMSGREVARLHVDPWTVSVGNIVCQLAENCKCRPRQLRLVFPGGISLSDGRDGGCCGQLLAPLLQLEDTGVRAKDAEEADASTRQHHQLQEDFFPQVQDDLLPQPHNMPQL